MKWNPQTRRYEDSKGKPIPESQIRQDVDEFIASNQDEVDNKTEELIAGTITVAAFFLFMRGMLTSMHGAAGVVAYGGEEQMGSKEWGRIAEKVASELAYLENFERQLLATQQATESLAVDAAALIARNADVPAGLESVVEQRVLSALMQGTSVEDAIAGALADSVGVDAAQGVAATVTADVLESQRMENLIWGQVSSRARMYPDAAFATYENSVKDRETDVGAIGARRITEGDEHVCDGCEGAASDVYVPISEIADIGDFECGGRDRCHFEFEYLGVEPLEIAREVYA